MTDDRTPDSNLLADLSEPVDVIAIERRARELRARAIGEGLRALLAHFRRRNAARPGLPQGRTA